MKNDSFSLPRLSGCTSLPAATHPLYTEDWCLEEISALLRGVAKLKALMQRCRTDIDADYETLRQAIIDFRLFLHRLYHPTCPAAVAESEAPLATPDPTLLTPNRRDYAPNISALDARLVRYMKQHRMFRRPFSL